MPKRSRATVSRKFTCSKCHKIATQTLEFELLDMDGQVAREYYQCTRCKCLNEIRFN